MSKTLADIDAMISRERQVIAKMEAERHEVARRAQVTARVYWLEQLQAASNRASKPMPKKIKRNRQPTPCKIVAAPLLIGLFDGDYTKQMEEVRREYRRRVRRREAALEGLV